MRKFSILAIAAAAILLAGGAWAHTSGTTEIGEGTVRKLYVKKPLVGAKGYVVGHWTKGKVRVEVKNFPASKTGYEVFLFKIDVTAFRKAMFVDGNPQKGVVSNPPPFSAVGKMVEGWHSLGDLKMEANGNGTLEYRKGDNLYKQGWNMVMVFEKKTPGRHKGPEDFGGLMVECNGPLDGTIGSTQPVMTIKVF
ncbi:MAG: hypothetical protein V3V56_03925 [bacterium]